MSIIQRLNVPYKTMKIVPHHSVLNSSTKKLQTSLYEMLSAKFPRYPWQHRNGMQVILRENPNLWWSIRMTNDDERGKVIEFYVTMPEDFIESFKIKIKNFEQWKRCTIEETEYPELIRDDTDLYKMKYERHNMFSLKMNFQEHTTPIRDVMSLSNELRDGEAISIFIRTEAVDRFKWKKLVEYAWENWDKGGMLYRSELDPSRIVKAVFSLGQSFMWEAKKILGEVMTGMERALFFHGVPATVPDSSLKRPVDPERAQLLVNGDLSDRTRHKRNLPSFKTAIRFTVTSPHPVRREVLARTVETSYSEMVGDNRLRAVKVNIKSREEIEELSHWRVKDLDPNIMSVEEVAKLQQLPTKELQYEFRETLVSNQRIEVEIPDVFADESGIFMGTSSVKGKEYRVHWPMKDKDMAYTPRVFIGSPRMGKDQDAINFIVEGHIKHGLGAVVPDVIDERNGHRGMSDALRDHIPPDHIIDINLGDFDWPVYLGLDSLTNDMGSDRMGGNLISQYLTNFLMGDDVDNHQTREYLREFSKAVGGDLVGIKLMCLSKKFRSEKIRELQEKGWDTLLLEHYHNNEGRQAAISSPILVRIGELLGDEFLKPIFGQMANPDVNLGKWMSEGKVVIFRIPSRKLGEMAVKTITYWITMLTFLSGISMDGQSPGTFLVMNEPHQFLTKGMIHFCKRMLLEGPKYRMAPLFLYHNPDVSKELKELHNIIMSSSVNWHIFKNSNINVYEDLEEYLLPTFLPSQAMSSTERFNFISCWLGPNGRYEAPFMTKAPDLVGKRFETMDNSNLTVEHSKRYGRNIDEVLQYIQERQRMIYLDEEDERPAKKKRS